MAGHRRVSRSWAVIERVRASVREQKTAAAYEAICHIARESRHQGINTPRGYALLSEVSAAGHDYRAVYDLMTSGTVRHWYDRNGLRLVPTSTEEE